ncbi:hypothetical protein OIU78_009420 [Salix suchowensis]|nr:hypothetical protein OIU78_009420 [Salix suchowensis]
MDIDPFWITGGRFIITDFNFMAPATKTSLCENTAKFQARVLFLSLLLIVPLLVRPIDLSRKSTASSLSTGTKHSATEMHPHESKNAPPSSTTTTAAAADMTSTTTTTKVPAASASDQLFRAAAHEVPSGPNPESN